MKSKVSVEEEYKKNPELNRKDVLEMMDWLKYEKPHFPLLNEFEIILNLHANYFDKEVTKTVIEACLELRRSYADLLTGLDVFSDEMQQALNCISVAPLPGETPEGYRVVLGCFNDPDPRKFDCKTFIKCLVLTFGCLVFEYGTTPGWIILIDFKGASWSHAFSFKLRYAIAVCKFVQDALPMRIITFEHYRFPLMQPVKFIRPFIKSEFYDKLKFNRRLADVHERIPEEMLPCDYRGGKAPALKELRENWIKILEERPDQFLEAEKLYKIDESKRPQSKKSSWLKIF